ncbi:MAG: Manganese transport system membrane protein MntB [Flavobacteriia bacterium]|nr:MAG: Manganese transport system membrane protein MntB [Flavobacteriia bacterium]
MNPEATIILIGILVSWTCGLLGVFLVVRRMSMLGDAISHAVLPGIVLSYLFMGERNSILLMAGAALSGVLVTVLIETLTRKARMQEQASVGISFTLFFAIGIILVSLYSGNVDIDADCVLYGEIAMTPFDKWSWMQRDMGSRHLAVLTGVLMVLGAAIFMGYKGLMVTSFNAEFALASGVAAAAWHYVLMSGVALVTVVSFEAVGAILVVGFLAIPPATAWIWTKRLPNMILLTLLFGALSAVSGFYVARLLDSSISASMTVVALLIFLFSLLLQKVKQKRVLDPGRQRSPHQVFYKR